MTFPEEYGTVGTIPTKGGKMPYNDPSQPKRLVVQISEELHTNLKVLAAKRKTTMDKLIKKLIERELELENQNN